MLNKYDVYIRSLSVVQSMMNIHVYKHSLSCENPGLELNTGLR